MTPNETTARQSEHLQQARYVLAIHHTELIDSLDADFARQSDEIKALREELTAWRTGKLRLDRAESAEAAIASLTRERDAWEREFHSAFSAGRDAACERDKANSERDAEKREAKKWKRRADDTQVELNEYKDANSRHIAERDEARAKLAVMSWEEGDDKPLPEDDAISAVHPATCDNPNHGRYQEALRMVGAKHSKYGLVNLVNWLLISRDSLAAQLEQEKKARLLAESKLRDREDQWKFGVEVQSFLLANPEHWRSDRTMMEAIESWPIQLEQERAKVRELEKELFSRPIDFRDEDFA